MADNKSNSQKGVIKFFKKDKGFGFITANDGKDVFFHITSCLSPEDAFRPEADVSFSTELDKDGRVRAINVTVL